MSTLAPPQTLDELHAQGELITVSGNTPFVIDGAERTWIVDTGRVELFSVELADGAPVGARLHYHTAGPGDVILGMDVAAVGGGRALLAVGSSGTRLRVVPTSLVRRLAAMPPCAPGIAAMVDQWLTGLSTSAARVSERAPRVDQVLAPGHTAELADGQRAHPEGAVVWVRHAAGHTVLLGLEPLAESAGLFPVAPGVFLEARGSARLNGLSTSEALEQEDGWLGLTAFHRAVFGCERHNERVAIDREAARLRQKAVRDERAREQALTDLIGVLEPQRVRVGLVDTDNALVAAAALVGSRAGVTVDAAATFSDAKGSDPLAELARSSRFRIRRVVLKGAWWDRETTPLLASVASDNRPVALLPRGYGEFELHDPSARTVVRVDQAVARTLAPVAHQFYRPFPERVREAGDLLRFGLEGALGDLRRPFGYGLIAGLLALLTPHVTGRIVDRIIPEAARSELLQMAAILAAVGFASAMLDVARRIGLVRLETKMSAAVAPAMWDRLMSLPVSFFRRYNAGDLAQRVSGVDRIRQALSGMTMTTLMLSVFSLLYLAQMFYYSWRLALLALGLVLVIVIVTVLCAVRKLRVSREVLHIEGRISGLVLQLLTGIPKLRVAAAEARAFAQWSRAFSHQKRQHQRGENADVAINTFNSVFNVVTSMCVFALMWHLTEDALDDGEVPLSIGDFVAFNAAFAIMLAQTLQMGVSVMTVMSIVPMFERSRPILDAMPEVDATKSDPGELTGRIDISHVSFRYQVDGPLVLHDVTAHIPAGKYVAIVGPSGSGKSTLLRLLLGLEQAETGAVYYDGRDLSQLDVQKLRRRIGVVVQNGRIRQGTLFDNIVGSQPLPLDDAWEAARMAGLEEDIERMPMGMHTVVQQGGGQLSGGQRQRLMIARAVVNRPRIVFLDEATSALDNRTQAIVTDSLARMQSTRVAIAHRLSTIINADAIIVMAGGKIVQSGTYQELVTQEGMFAELVRRQIA